MLTRWVWVGGAFVLAMASLSFELAGCGSSSAGAQPDAGPDRVTVDSPVYSNCNGNPPVMTWAINSQPQVPDFGCYAPDAQALDFDAGDASDAATDAVDESLTDGGAGEGGGADGSVPVGRFHLTDFQSSEPIPDAVVDLFNGDTVRTAPDFTGTTGGIDAGVADAGIPGTGEFFFPLPASSLFAYRVHARGASAGVAPIEALIEFDVITPLPGQRVDGNSINQSGFNLLVAGILGAALPAAGTATIAIPARDCAGHDLAGVIVELIDDATGQPVPTGTGPTDFHTGYFSNGVPNSNCTFTSADQALWAAVNGPTNGTDATKSYSVRLSGRMSDADASPAVFAQKKVELWGDTINVLRPYRLRPD
jgi:hypothetical protein